MVPVTFCCRQVSQMLEKAPVLLLSLTFEQHSLNTQAVIKVSAVIARRQERSASGTQQGKKDEGRTYLMQHKQAIAFKVYNKTI